MKYNRFRMFLLYMSEVLENKKMLLCDAYKKILYSRNVLYVAWIFYGYASNEPLFLGSDCWF